MTGVEELWLGTVNVEETAALETPSTRRHAPRHGCDSGEFTEGDLEKGPASCSKGLDLGPACHTQFCEQNQVLITCVSRIIYSTHMDIKCS
jgi:hypothetical protein